jgi:hypothetical protein
MDEELEGRTSGKKMVKGSPQRRGEVRSTRERTSGLVGGEERGRRNKKFGGAGKEAPWVEISRCVWLFWFS